MASGDPSSDPDRSLGQLALESGFITREQFEEAVADQAREAAAGRTPSRPLGAILVDKGYLNDGQLASLMDRPSLTEETRLAATPSVSKVAPILTALGKYTLVRELGRGGMGVVYEAIDERLGRKVALKLMLTAPHADAKQLAQEEDRFIREAHVTAKLRHPNIVTVFEAGVLEGRRFLAMELIDGVPFSVWRRREGVSPHRQIEGLRDVVLAVQHAHAAGVLHRDIKPHNVLVDATGRPIVMDFGLAKPTEQSATVSLTTSGMLVGTPTYMSPEQAQGSKTIDGRTDIYSLGVMLYEILTGQPPFRGDSPIETLVKVVKDPVPLPSRVVKAVPGQRVDKAIENICLKALAKDPEERYATAQAFAEDLTKWLHGDEVKVVPPGARRRRFVRLATYAAALFVAALAYLVLTSRPSIEAELSQARRLMEEGKHTEALGVYGVALRKEPTSAAAIAGREAALKGGHDARLREVERLREEIEKTGDRQARPDEIRALEEKLKSAEEAARRAQEDLRQFTIVPALPPEDAWKKAVDLLALIDPARDTVAGKWTRQAEGLVSDATTHARIEIPYRPPAEYDVRMVFKRLASNGDVNLLFASSGRPQLWMMGGYENRVFGFELIRGRHASENPTTFRAVSCLENGRSYTAVVQVRKNGLRAWLDGKLISEALSLDPATARVHPSWALRAPDLLGLGSFQSPAAFQRVEILDLTTPGTAVPVPPMRAFQPVTVDAAALAPGLIGEYHAGRNFETPALRKIDPAISFRWGIEPAWPGGPRDFFSCRWSGFLKVPRAGNYRFTALSSDGVRIALDGEPILENWTSHPETENSVECLLEEGLHRIRVEHFEEVQAATIVLSWAETGPIGPESFFHDPAEFKPIAPAVEPRAAASRTLSGHSKSVRSVAISPDGKFAASGSIDATVKIWETATAREVRTLEGHAKGLLAVTFSPDGKSLLSGGFDDTIHAWDAETGARMRSFAGHLSDVYALVFSPDGRLILSGSADKTMALWEAASGKRVRVFKGHEDRVNSVAFSPDGRRAASASWDRTAALWDVETGGRLRSFEGHANRVQFVAFSPDGKILATGARDNLIKLWDPETGGEIRSLAGHQGEVMSLAFAPDGKTLASGSNDATIRLWDVDTGRQTRALAGHASFVESIAISRDGRTLVSGSHDSTVRLWNLSP